MQGFGVVPPVLPSAQFPLIYYLFDAKSNNIMNSRDRKPVRLWPVSCSLTLGAISNSYERKDEQVVPDWTSHEERKKVKDTAIGKQHVTSKYPALH